MAGYGAEVDGHLVAGVIEQEEMVGAVGVAASYGFDAVGGVENRYDSGLSGAVQDEAAHGRLVG